MSVIVCRPGLGLGNGMCAYAFARAYANRVGAELQMGDWIGKKVFGLTEPPITTGLVKRSDLEFEKWDGETNIEIEGYAQHQKHLIYSRKDALRWFRFLPEYLELVRDVPAKPLVAQLRWGDFISAHNFIAISTASYVNACHQFNLNYMELYFLNNVEHYRVEGIEVGLPWTEQSIGDKLTRLDWLPDFFLLMRAKILLRGPSTFGWWAGVLGEHHRIFSPNQAGIAHAGPRPLHQDVPFVEGNHMPITAWWEGHSELRLPAGGISMSHSQAGQDLWVSERAGVPKGTFLDIGSGHPTENNNTYALEKAGWDGICLDQHQPSIELYASLRSATAILGDATKVMWHKLIPCKFVDYLSLDVDEFQVHALENLLAEGIRFRVATIEHDSYRFGNGPRDSMRQLLTDHGYVIDRKDVMCGPNPFEDWWVDPKLV